MAGDTAAERRPSSVADAWLPSDLPDLEDLTFRRMNDLFWRGFLSFTCKVDASVK